MTYVAIVLAMSAAGSLDEIMPPGAKVEQVATGFGFLEGPAWDGKESLYFSDLMSHKIHRVGEDGKAAVYRENSGQANGLMFDKDAMLVACEHQGRRVSRTRADGTVVAVAEKFDGKPLNSPNDLVIDADGGIYFTDPRYGGKFGPKEPPEQDKEAVYYVTPKGEVSRVSTDGKKPNGVNLSPDGRTLFIADHGAQHVLALEVTGPGRLANPRVYAELEGRPDGMCVDTAGRLYVTGEGGIWVFRPAREGKAESLGVISVPEHASNCTFGGVGMDVLYITASSSLYKVKLSAHGWMPGRTVGGAEKKP